MRHLDRCLVLRMNTSVVGIELAPGRLHGELPRDVIRFWLRCSTSANTSRVSIVGRRRFRHSPAVTENSPAISASGHPPPR
jgi:hypothetical protein